MDLKGIGDREKRGIIMSHIGSIKCTIIWLLSIKLMSSYF